jgi:Flp pilus assembly protein TadD
MKTSLFVSLALALGLAVSAPANLLASARDDAKAHLDFGNRVAVQGLWREAIFRWQKATEIDPTYAEAYNNLGVGYEHEGQLDKARKAYETALELEPNNTRIQQNYELFKEINDRAAQTDKP